MNTAERNPQETVPAIVDFHGTRLLSKKLEDGTIVVAMKPIVEGMGLNWASQYVKLEAQKEKFNCCDIAMVAADGKERLMLTMPLTKLNGWLFSINPANIPDTTVRSTVVLYQEECFHVLHDYWHKGAAINPTFQRYRTRLPSLQTVLNTFTVAIKAAKASGRTQRQALESANACTIKAYGIDCLDLLSIDLNRIPESEVKNKVTRAKSTQNAGLDAVPAKDREKCIEARSERLSVAQQFWLEILQTGRLRPEDERWMEQGVPYSDLFKGYGAMSEQMKEYRPHIHTTLIRELKKLCPGIFSVRVRGKDRVLRNYLVVPTLDECRAKFESAVGTPIQWKEVDHE